MNIEEKQGDYLAHLLKFRFQESILKIRLEVLSDFFIITVAVVLVAQLCPTLCDSIGCNLPGSSVLEIPQARILEWIDIPFSRRSPQLRIWIQVSLTAGRFLPPESLLENNWFFQNINLSKAHVTLYVKNSYINLIVISNGHWLILTLKLSLLFQTYCLPLTLLPIFTSLFFFS